jgi:hypothetical protein
MKNFEKGLKAFIFNMIELDDDIKQLNDLFMDAD